MNGGFQTSRDEIGIDPTTIAVVDTLDLGDNNNQNAQGPNKKKGKAKEMMTKIAFAFGILLLMGLVAFGIYFYLNLGKKKANEKPKFVLEDKTVYLGSELSASILDYGNFAAVDISGCSLDTSNVNTDKTGTYEYSMTCDGSKYTGNITVIEKYDYEVTSNVMYKTSSDVLIASEFIKGSDEYTYSIKDNNVTNYLYTPGGPYYIDIEIEEKGGKKGHASSVFYVTESNARTFLTCTSTVKEPNAPNAANYRIVDKFAFDGFKSYLNVPSRIYLYENLTAEQYVNFLNSIENGKVKIGDVTGYALRDDINSIFRVAVEFTDEDFNKETEKELTSYDDIKEYYEDQGYHCE